MKDDQLPQQIALFRYGLIADLIHPTETKRDISALLQRKAAISYNIPGSTRTRVEAETIRHWLKLYRKGGFDALLPKSRNDKGASRALSRKIMDQLLSIKEERPGLTVAGVIDYAYQSGMVTRDIMLAPTTVYRLLVHNGLIRKEHADPATKDHRRFMFQHPGELWMADVMHGPSVWTPDRKKRKTYLIATIDDATRVIPYAAFALGERAIDFLEVFRQAILRRGIPQRLFVDNGAAFRCHHLELVCARLGITLIHARAYHAQAKGKIERWFRTVRMQLLPCLGEDELRSLGAINSALRAYIETEYHHSLHRILGMTPLEKWAASGHLVRFPPPDTKIDELFLAEAKRKVQRDRTISIEGRLYEVDAVLVGETVTLRHDPAKPGSALQVWCKGKRFGDATILDVYANCRVKRDRPSRLILTEKVEHHDPIPQPAAPKHPLCFAALAKAPDTQPEDNR